MLGQEPAVGDQPALDTGPDRRLHQRNNVWMDQRLAPLECHVPNPAAAQDWQSPRELGEIDISAWSSEGFVARETTEIARGITYIRDGNIADRGKRVALSSWCDCSKRIFH
jgi:hypothetical protein